MKSEPVIEKEKTFEELLVEMQQYMKNFTEAIGEASFNMACFSDHWDRAVKRYLEGREK